LMSIKAFLRIKCTFRKKEDKRETSPLVIGFKSQQFTTGASHFYR